MTLAPANDEPADSAMSTGSTEVHQVKPEPSAGDTRQNKADRGSWSEHDNDRPRWTSATALETEYPYHGATGKYSYSVLKGRPKVFAIGRRYQGRYGELAMARQENPRDFYNYDGLENFMIGMGDQSPLLYRLPEIITDMAARPDDVVFFCEGEKDVETLRELGQIATTGPNGALASRQGIVAPLAGKRIAILTDKDANGKKHEANVSAALRGVGASFVAIELPGLAEHGDVTDWLVEREVGDLLAEVERAFAASEEEGDERDGEEPISQIVVARIYADRRGSQRRYDHNSGKWMHVDRVSGIWKPDDRRATFNEIGGVVHEIGGGVARYSNAGFISGTETIARGLPAIAVTQDQFDADKMILGTPAGPVDLRTGRLMPPNPALLVSRSTSVVPTAGEPVQWLRFLAQSTGGDADMIAFLQRAVGYMLTGVTIEQALFFIYGDGGNGKGVFINVVRRILADYAVTSAMDTFTASKHEQHSTNLAMLRGARLVTASETEKGKAWAEARMKQLTGSDEISARFMRQDNFSFVPEFKLLIIGNFHPVLNTVDDAMRRRFNIIPFNRKPDAPNPNLEQELEVEFPRILAWMIEGCLGWQRDGLKRPAAVVKATAEYFDDQDLFGQWIEEFCECDRGYTATSQELFHNWSMFASDMNEEAGSSKGFGALLTKRGFTSGRATTGSRARLWEGLRLQKVHDDRSGGWVAKSAQNSSLRAI